LLAIFLFKGGNSGPSGFFAFFFFFFFLPPVSGSTASSGSAAFFFFFFLGAGNALNILDIVYTELLGKTFSSIFYI
jgi:hypothetical protein